MQRPSTELTQILVLISPGRYGKRWNALAGMMDFAVEIALVGAAATTETVEASQYFALAAVTSRPNFAARATTPSMLMGMMLPEGVVRQVMWWQMSSVGS